MKINICHITQSAGGVENYILNVIQHSNKQKFKHIVICFDNGNLATRAQKIGAKVVLIKMVREISIFKDVQTILNIILYLKKNRPDIIYAHSAKGGVYGRVCGFILRIPVVFTPHAFSYLSQTGLKKKITLIIEKILSNHTFFLVPSSESERDRAIFDVGWKRSNVLETYYNSITISKLKRIKKNNDEKIIISIARLTYQKNPLLFVDIAIRTIEKRRNTIFYLIGAGYTDEYSTIISNLILKNKLENQIIVLPWMDHDEISNYLEKADIYLSTSRYEGLPTALLLAMDREVPIVATNIDGNKDVVIHGETGFLSNSEDELVKYIITLADTPSLCFDMGRKSKILLENKFDIRKNIEILEKIIYSVVIQNSNNNT